LKPAGSWATLDSGVQLHYRVQGRPGAPWVVLINGLLSDATMWAGVLPGLTADFRVLTFDCRGQGRSDAPREGPYTPALMAQDAWELLEHLQIRQPWLAGLSNGSSVGLELLAAHPGAFRGALLTSAVAWQDFTMRLRLEHWLHCLELGGPGLQFDAVAPYLWGDRFLAARYRVLKAYHETKNEPGKPFHGLRHQIVGALQWDIRPRLGEIKDPVRLVCGAEDLLTPPWKCLELARALGHGEFRLVPGVGHALPVEDPKAYCQIMRTFLSDY